MTQANPYGFVAGTLVHTDQGLVPIEQLKVGDLVLSKPESGEGEVAYKRVLRTFVSAEKQKIMRIAYVQPGSMDPHFIKTIIDENNGDYNVLCSELREPRISGEFYIFCTENHPFWTKESGWVAAKDIAESGFYDSIQYAFENMYGIPLFVYDSSSYRTPLNKTPIDGVAAVVNQNLDSECRNEVDALIDFRSGRPLTLVGVPAIDEFPGVDSFHEKNIDASQELVNFEIFNDHPILNELLALDVFEFGDTGDESRCFLDTVYNVELEDYHTYFVGESGVWIHH